MSTKSNIKNEVIYKCRSCKKEAEDSSSLAAHIRSTACLFRNLIRVPAVRLHRLPTFLCYSCGLLLHSKEQFEPHFKLVHGNLDGNDVVKTQVLGQIFQSPKLKTEFYETDIKASTAALPAPPAFPIKSSRSYLCETNNHIADIASDLKILSKRKQPINDKFLYSIEKKLKLENQLKTIIARNGILTSSIKSDNSYTGHSPRIPLPQFEDENSGLDVDIIELD